MKTTLTATAIFFSLFLIACDDEQGKEISAADLENITFDDAELIQAVTEKLDSPFTKSNSESDDIRNISFIVLSMVKGKTEKSGDYWQTPKETWEKKTGDCEDISMLIAYCCKQILNVEPDLVIIKKQGILHAIIHYDNIYYDYGNKFSEKELDIIDSVEYKYALAFAGKYHTNYW